MGKIIAIWLKRSHRGVMDPVTSARLVAQKGLVGNADQGGKRQITIISDEAWSQALAQIAASVSPAARRANLMLHGLDLEQTRGRLLKLGPCHVRVYSETRPCERMDEAHPGLLNALSPHWRAGISCEVLDDGEIKIGNAANWEE